MKDIKDEEVLQHIEYNLYDFIKNHTTYKDTDEVFSYAGITYDYKRFRDLVDKQLIDISSGSVPWLALGTDHEWADSLNRQFTGKVLLDAVRDICNTFDYGFEFTWNRHGFIFNLYKGTDRSFAQFENPYVVFSPAFENIGNTEYTYDTSNYANACIIGGEGEGASRVFVGVSPEGLTGFHRRVIYIDARSSSSNDITADQYKAQLTAQGIEELELRKVTTSFSSEILNTNTYRYGVDYTLGDKVSAINEFGIKGNATITEITEVEDSSGYRAIPTFSEWTAINYEEDE